MFQGQAILAHVMLCVWCASIVVWLDVDVCTVGLLGAAQPQVIPPTSQCNSRLGRLECQTRVYRYILKCFRSR